MARKGKEKALSENAHLFTPATSVSHRRAISVGRPEGVAPRPSVLDPKTKAVRSEFSRATPSAAAAAAAPPVADTAVKSADRTPAANMSSERLKHHINDEIKFKDRSAAAKQLLQPGKVQARPAVLSRDGASQALQQRLRAQMGSAPTGTGGGKVENEKPTPKNDRSFKNK